jgi:Tol biopolymer transport system component
MAGSVTLHDVARDGRALLTRDNTQVGILVRAAGDEAERDLSWHDWSLVRDLSADGSRLLFTEAGEGGGATYGVYLRRLDGAEAVRLGDGSALALSPDGRWALARAAGVPARLVLLPTRSGQAVWLEPSDLVYQQWASWFPDGERVVFAAAEPGRGTRLYAQAIGGGAARPITDAEGVHLSSPNSVSPDGAVVAAVGPDGRPALYPVSGREPCRIAGAERGDRPLRWAADGGELVVREGSDAPARLVKVDLRTGRRDRWRELMPADRAGVHEILRVVLAADGEAYAYSYTRELSDLYLVEGLG